jgi:solute carrier family 10 (sodium/bile acid cotransporter), member 7
MKPLRHYFHWFDPFVAALMLMVVVATWLPCQGQVALFFNYCKNIAIVLLFFLHGAKLSREAILNGLLHWRLHLATLLVTFGLFPILGLAVIRVPGIDPALLAGLLFLTLLPSTVQSSIAFTSLARGNVPAAVCAATLSNLLGIFLTPMLVAMLMNIQGVQANISFDMVRKIALQLLLPFVVGHLARPWIGKWVTEHKKLIGQTDRSSILLVVYTAFSEAVVQGLWSRCPWWSFCVLVILCSVLLTIVLLASWGIGRSMGLSRADAIVLLFCGSKKSLVSGVPMASVLFPATQVGMILLPLMIFHQIQLIVCAVIARLMGRECPP